jgi:catechol 2,3-dioxygenase-like lactoylglutathione lyase family enzyme
VIELLEGSFDRLIQRVIYGDTGAESPPIERSALHHVGVRVEDADAGASAYAGAFGANVHGGFSPPIELAQPLFGAPTGSAVDVRFLDFGGGVGCEVFAFRHPFLPFAPAVASRDAFMHLGFHVAAGDHDAPELQYTDVDGHPVELTNADFTTHARSWARVGTASRGRR